MKLKTFILTFLMMSCSIVFGQGTMTGNASNENWLKAHLADSDYGTIILANDIELTTGNIVIPNGRTVTIDLNGNTLSTTDNSTYIINNLGKLTIKDSNESGKGKISAYGGIHNGKTYYNPNVRTAFGDVNLNAKLTIESGVIEDISSDKRAVIYNYGMLYITGGKFYGKYSGITNYGMADIKNTYIECLGADNDVAAIVNDFDITFGENVYIAGEYRAVTGTAAYTGTPIFLYAELNGKKYLSLQDAINNAKTNETVTLIADNCKEDVTVTQAPDYVITIDGADKTFKGTITVDGKSARYETTALTIKNVKFDATEGISADACINLGAEGNNNTRYTNNVTVENCTFTDNDYSSVAVKSYTGGDWNLKISNCIVKEGMHSLAQVTNVEKGMLISGCKVYSKNGINLNSSAGVVVENSMFETQGYAVRVGVDGGTSGAITLKNNTLKTDNSEGDAVIIVRGNAVTQVDLNMTQNVVSGTTHISGNTAATKIAADENYWDGKEGPVVAEGSAPIVVNSYYSDATLSTLVRNEMGSINAFVSSDRITGDVTTNAKESIKIEIIGKDGNLIGTSSLEKLSHITGFNKQLTWRINLGADNSDSWAMTWVEGNPSINNMPAKVRLHVDEEEVAEAEIRYTANGDGASPVFAARTNEEGKILAFIANDKKYNLENAGDMLNKAIASAEDDNIIELFEDITASEIINIRKSITINGNSHKVTSNANRVFLVDASNINVTLNNVNMVSRTEMVYPQDIRGININRELANIVLTLNECSVDFTDETACDWSYAVNVAGDGNGHKITVDGGTYEGANVVNVHGSGNTIVVKNATLNCLYPLNDYYNGACIWVKEEAGSEVEATGNTFNGDNAIAFNLGTGTELVANNNTDNTKCVVAKVNETYYYSLPKAVEEAQAGETVYALQDVTLDEILVINKAITLEGRTLNGYDRTLTSTANRAINVDCAGDVTIKKLVIATTNNTERAINVIQKATNLVLDNVTAEGFKYTINVANSSVGSTITTKGGKYSGYAAVNITSNNTTFTSNETEFVGVNNVAENESNNFAVIAVNENPTENVKVNINGGKVTAKAENSNRQYILVVGEAQNTEIVIDAELEIVNNDVLNATVQDGLTVKFRADYAEALKAQSYATSEADGGLIQVKGSAVAEIDGKYYASLQEAINNVKNNETITLLVDCDEIVHINKSNVAFTIDGKISETEKVDFSGVIEINIGQNVTITNIDFTGAKADHDFITNEGSPTGKNYNTTLLVKDCSFTGNSEFDVVGVRTKHPLHTQIVNCTADGLHSLLQNTGGQEVTVDNVVVTKGKEGGLALGGVKAADVKNSEITASGYGVRVDAATANAVFNIESSTFNAYIPVIARKATAANVNFTFSGENEMTQTNEDEVWFVIEGDNSKYHEGEASLEDLKAPTGQVSVTLNDTGLDRNGIYGNYGVAKIGNATYNTFADAATAAQDGETIQLLWNEGDAAIAMAATFVGDKTVTITGTANVDWSKGWLYVGRNGEGNGKIIFNEANLTSVSNSSGLGLNVSGKKNGSNDTNNGTVEIINSTIVLDYMLNKNVITLNNSTLTVKNGFAVGGRPASETESGEDATATMTLTNNSKVIVDNHNGMGLGYEAIGVMNIDATSSFETTKSFLITAKGTMNVNGGNVKVAGTLTNNGTVYVTGEANLDATVTGNGWFYMNGVTLDADTKLLGAKVGFINGENNIVGSTIKDGFFSVGIGQNDAAAIAATFAEANGIELGDVTVNVSDNAVISGNGSTYSGWVGSAYSADKTQNTYTLNVENSLATFGYMHVSKDGAIKVDGRSAENNRYTQDNVNVSFYAGDFIINGNVTLNNTDAWAKFTKVSVDHEGGILNITGDTKYEASIHNGSATGASLVFYKAGEVNIANGTTVEIDNATTLVEGAVLNIASDNVIAKGTVTNNGGTINLTDLSAKFTAHEGLTVNNGVVGNTEYGVTYLEGAYQFAKYVAQIGDEKYFTLKEAINDVEDDCTITLLANETFTENNRTTNSNWYEGIYYQGDKSFTIDLAEYIIGQDGSVNDYLLLFKNEGEKDNTITLKNGTIDAGTAAYCALATASLNTNKMTINTENITFVGNNLNGAVLKIRGGAELNVNAGTIITGKDNYVGIEAAGNNTVVNINVDTEIYQKGTSSYVGSLVGASYNATVNVYGGKGTSAKGGFIVMSTGGTINVSGGEWIANNDGTSSNENNAVLISQNNRYESGWASKSVLNVTGGTFKGGYNCYGHADAPGFESDDAQINITGGNFNADPTNYVEENYVVKVEADNTYSVVEDQVAKIGDVTYNTLQKAFNAAQDGDEIVVLKDVTYTKATGVPNGDSFTDGLVYTGDKSFTVNFDGHTITEDGGINNHLVYLKNMGDEANEITFKNGKIATNADRTTTAFAAIAVGASTTDTTTLNLNNMVVVNGNPNRDANYTIRIRKGSIVNLNENTVVTSNGTSYGVIADGSTVNINNGAKVVQTNSGATSGGNVVYTAVSGNGTINVYEGATIESDKYGIHNTTTGKTVINIYGGTITASTAVRVATNGGSDQSAVANILGGTITGNLATYTDAASIVIKGGIFSVDPSEYCAENYGAFPYDATSWIVREIYGEQTFDLVAGWNWVSSYITEFEGETGLAMLQNSLGTNGIQIKNDDYTSTYRNNGWSGKLTSVYVNEMYKVNMSAGVNFKFEGSFVNYDEQVIVLRPGWNYIGYPVNVETNLADALVILSADGNEEYDGANVGDVIKSQQGTATYIGSSEWLFGNQFNLIPGEGYMYKNTSDEVKILRYTTKNAATSSETETNTRSSNHWTVDVTQYPSNMTMIAMTDVEGGNYEVAAFVNGEVRGSSRPVYVESLDAYILILTISGDDVEETTFKYYDLTTGEEVEFSNRINYSNDAIVGSINEPYMLTRGTTGIGEAAMSNINIYPNPTTTGTEINLQATCDKVEVFNALGAKVAEYQNVDSIDALETAGIYVIRITNNGNVQNCRLVVK